MPLINGEHRQVSIDEWLSGVTTDGIPLDPFKTDKYRANRGLAPLLGFVRGSLPPPNVASSRSDRKNLTVSSVSRKTPLAPVIGVGTSLHDLLVSIGLNPPCVTCGTYARQMDNWGIEACKTERYAEIVAHLKAEAMKPKNWLDWPRVLLAGYLSSEALLNKAIEMAEAKQRETRGESLL